jgi:hypothetical protein
MRPANLPKLLAATAVAAVTLGATPLAQAGVGIPGKHPDKHPDIIGVLKHPDRHPNIIGVLEHPDIIGVLKHPDMRKAGGDGGAY